MPVIPYALCHSAAGAANRPNQALRVSVRTLNWTLYVLYVWIMYGPLLFLAFPCFCSLIFHLMFYFIFGCCTSSHVHVGQSQNQITMVPPLFYPNLPYSTKCTIASEPHCISWTDIDMGKTISTFFYYFLISFIHLFSPKHSICALKFFVHNSVPADIWWRPYKSGISSRLHKMLREKRCHEWNQKVV